MSDLIYYNPREACIEIHGKFGHTERNAIYRRLNNGTFKPLEEATGFKILKDNNRYMIPGGLVKEIRRQGGL